MVVIAGGVRFSFDHCCELDEGNTKLVGVFLEREVGNVTTLIEVRLVNKVPAGLEAVSRLDVISES